MPNQYKNIELDDNYKKFVEQYKIRFNRKANLLFSDISQNNSKQLFETYETAFIDYLYDRSTDTKVPKDIALEVLNRLDYRDTWIEIINAELEKFTGQSLFSQLSNTEKKSSSS